MAVPRLESIMLPLLKYASDGKEHTRREAIETMAKEFGLTDEERNARTPSGRVRFDVRVGWARAHLKGAGLLEAAGRGSFRISSRGLQVLAANPVAIDHAFLKQFPEFRAFEGENPTRARGR